MKKCNLSEPELKVLLYEAYLQGLKSVHSLGKNDGSFGPQETVEEILDGVKFVSIDPKPLVKKESTKKHVKKDIKVIEVPEDDSPKPF